MAFPGTFNINYYKGDTYEFRIYPKDSSGNPFPLSDYISPNGTTKFTMAPRKGPLQEGEEYIEGYASISNDQTFILCAITPANGAQMAAGSTYYYDVEIARADAPYDFVYTLLKGNISVEEQVTVPGDLVVPDNPINLVYEATSNSIEISWTAPISGASPDGYKLYLIEYTTDPLIIGAALASPPIDTTTDPSVLTYTFEGLDPLTGYLVGVLAYNEVGDAPTASLLTNLLSGPIITLPEES